MTQNPPRSTSEIDEIMAKLAAYRSWLVSSKRSEIIARPKYAEALNQQITDLEALVETAEREKARGPDGGLLGMIGLGQNALENIGDTPYMPSIPEYDDQVNRERISAIADLYYIYQHERLGVFRAVLKLQDLFRSGSVRLSDGAGAVKLYQYDRKQILRYTQRDRRAAYRKVFGYTDTAPPDGAEPNSMFHPLFTQFTQQVSQFFQDKRVSEVIRPDGRTGTYGSQAVVRRSGLDLRHNLKQVSYGHIAILKTEVMGLLNAAFEILDSPDIRHLFGSNSAWDTLEEVMKRHLSETPIISQRGRMAVAGRDILRWLGEDFLVTNVRTDLETYLEDIVDSADDWLTSAESLGLQRQSGMTGAGNVVPLTTRKLKSG